MINLRVTRDNNINAPPMGGIALYVARSTRLASKATSTAVSTWMGVHAMCVELYLESLGKAFTLYFLQLPTG